MWRVRAGMRRGPALPRLGQCFSPQRSECREEETDPQTTNPTFSSAPNESRQGQNRSMLLAPRCPDLTTVQTGPGDVAAGIDEPWERGYSGDIWGAELSCNCCPHILFTPRALVKGRSFKGQRELEGKQEML